MRFLARLDFGMLIFTLLSTFTRFRDIFFPLLEIRTDKSSRAFLCFCVPGFNRKTTASFQRRQR